MISLARRKLACRSLVYRANALKLNCPIRSIVSDAVSSVECWKCHVEIGPSDVICLNKQCNSIQNLSKDCNLFHVFGFEVSFKISESSLESSFKALQKHCHPDKHTLSSLTERDISMDLSSRLNQYFQVLKSPVERARYIVKLVFGIDALADNQTTSSNNNHFMAQCMEYHERIDDSVDTELPNIKADVILQISNVEDRLDLMARTALPNQKESAVELVVRLKYLTNIVMTIDRKLDA